MAITKINADAMDLTDAYAFTGTVTSQGTARAWVNFNGTGTVAIRDSHNVSSLTDHGTGDYTVTFSITMANINYLSVGMGGNTGSGLRAVIQEATEDTPATGSCRYHTVYSSGEVSDAAYVGIAIFGD